LTENHSGLALFILSFLAATGIPVGSEWLLVLVLLKGYDPTSAVVPETVGNSLGACTTYVVGFYGGIWLSGKIMKISAEQKARSRKLYQRYGSWTLLLSWLPVIGDPICLVGGVLRVRFWFF